MDLVMLLEWRFRAVAGAAALGSWILGGCSGQRLEVEAGPKTQENAVVECSLVEPWPGPSQIQLNITVRSPCRTARAVFIHVFAPIGRGSPLASVRRNGPVELGRVGRFTSGVFQAPPAHSEVSVEVVSECERRDAEPPEHVHGETRCQVP